MDIASLVGFVGAFGMVLAIMQMTGGLLLYWDFPSVVIVLGGSAMVTMVRWPLPKYISGLLVVTKVLTNKVPSPNELIDEIIELANTARKNSILALEKVPIENPYLAKAVKSMVDGQNAEVIADILDTDMESMSERHKAGRGIMENMGESAPAMGMIGTVMGLIVIMANLSDPNAIGPGLAVALVTTLYGAMVANMVFIPFAAKLKYRSNEELVNLEIIQKGVTAILAGENPRLIRERLEAFIGNVAAKEE